MPCKKMQENLVVYSSPTLVTHSIPQLVSKQQGWTSIQGEITF